MIHANLGLYSANINFIYMFAGSFSICDVIIKNSKRTIGGIFFSQQVAATIQ